MISKKKKKKIYTIVLKYAPIRFAINSKIEVFLKTFLLPKDSYSSFFKDLL